MSPLALDAAKAELEAECAALLSAPSWARNRALNAAAYAVGQLVGAGLLKEAFVAKRLKAAARAAGYHARYGGAHVDRFISAGLAAGITRPVVIFAKPKLVPIEPRESRWKVPRVDTPPVRHAEPVEASRPARAPRQAEPPTEPSELLSGRQRKRCGARARSRGGAPCQCKVVPGRTRCKLHGGMSTGPKTPEGRARTSEGARRYHAERRAKSTLG